MRTGSRANASVAIVVLVFAMTSRARAQTAEAEALFREGKRLLKQGEITRACEKFEASERLEPENGTELNLADCWERDGRTASAWAMFMKAAASAKRADRAAEARRRAAALESQLVHLTIEVPVDADLDELVITRNDDVVDRALWNQRVPVDPDEYTITASAPEHEEWSATIKVKTKDKVVVVPELERRRGARKSKNKTKTRGDSTHVPAAPNKYRAVSIGLALGGGGAIAISTGIALHSKSLADRSDAACPTTSCRDSYGVELNRRARLEGWVANIGWGLGGAALVGAVVTWYLDATSRDGTVSVAPTIGDDGAGLALGGRF